MLFSLCISDECRCSAISICTWGSDDCNECYISAMRDIYMKYRIFMEFWKTKSHSITFQHRQRWRRKNNCKMLTERHSANCCTCYVFSEFLLAITQFIFTRFPFSNVRKSNIELHGFDFWNIWLQVKWALCESEKIVFFFYSFQMVANSISIYYIFQLLLL